MEWQEGFEPSTSCMAQVLGRLSYYHMERKAGLEPTSRPWKGHALPLRYFREVAGGGGSRPYPLPAPPAVIVISWRYSLVKVPVVVDVLCNLTPVRGNKKSGPFVGTAPGLLPARMRYMSAPRLSPERFLAWFLSWTSVPVMAGMTTKRPV
jgi:hypothetical protein